MPKSDLVRRTDQIPHIRNGELVTGATVIQVSQLAMTAPYSGDFQIIDAGRLIVGENPDTGARMIISNSGIHGYGSAGIHTFGVYSNGDATHGSGDWFAGNEAANHIAYNQQYGTLGLYTPAGAGFIATRDGSLQAGNASGAHMLWNSASRALEIRNGDDVKISLADTGDAFLDGTIYANGGRIYGDMQVDAKLIVGDTDGPNVSIGKFERYDDDAMLVESAEIVATDSENLPWFRVVAGGGTAAGGYFHLGAPGDYKGKMTFDGTTLQVAGWNVDAQAFVTPNGYARLDTQRGLAFVGLIDPDTDDPYSLRNYMMTFWENSLEDEKPSHRIFAYVNPNTATINEQIFSIQAQPLTGNRATLRLSSLGDMQAHTEIRAVGGYDTANQQYTSIDIWAYHSEGAAFGYRRIDLQADAVQITPYTGASEPSGNKPDGLLMYTTASGGAYDPGLGAGLYLYASSAWRKIRGPGLHRWGSVTNYTEIDANGTMTFVGSARIRPRYRAETKVADFTASTSGDVVYYRVNTTGGAVTATLPPAADANGFVYVFKVINGANNLVIDGNGSETIDGATTYTISSLYGKVTLFGTGTAWEIIA